MSKELDIPLAEALAKFDMEATTSSGLKWVSDKDKEVDPYIFIALEQAADFGAKAVYLRFFDNERPPRPQVYIYAFDDLDTAKEKGADIHHHLWNAGVVPYVFIFGSTEILVYSCGEKPVINNDGNSFITTPNDTIKLLHEVQAGFEKYNARQFDSGLFWDSETGKNFKYDQSAYEQLLLQLKNVKANIISRVGTEKSALVKRLLMMLILIKYLEERKDEHGNGALNPKEFYTAFNPNDPTLEGVLCDADTLAAMLERLSTKEHFNGQIFHLDQNELTLLYSIDLELFRHFVKGEVSIFSKANQGVGQMSLWRLYQFSYLPIELISHIYEDFLADDKGQKKKGVVYTPPYLVQFLIDRCMPLNTPKAQFKILDPACGSGIFLVGAFKRMIQWWRLRNNWAKPTKEHIEELKRLLVNNIYGCDLEDEAITLSYFSLGLALLDALSPKEIWNNVHFDNLVGTNLFAGDFFKTLGEKKLPDDFDLVIGNPPFDSKLTEWAIKINKTAKNENPERPDVPDQQIALLFLEQSFERLKPNGKTCMILPSGPVLYNTKTHTFKKYLFERNYFSTVYDFTALRARLFTGSSSKAKPAVAAVFAERVPPDGHKPVNHLIFRRTRASSEKIEFEIDHYDIHKVAYRKALTNPRVWQANFMGGGRLHKLLERIDPNQTLGAYLDIMEKNYGWKVAEGWIESSDSSPLKRISQLQSERILTLGEEKELADLEAKHKANWITGHNFIETKSLSGNSTLLTPKCTAEYFLRPRKKNKEIFQPPHLLIKESVTGKKIPVLYSEQYLTFKDQIFGIHAPEQFAKELKSIAATLSSNQSVPLMWLVSGKVVTSREGVPNKVDILSLPYPPMQFDKIENILLNDIASHYSSFRKRGEKSDLLKNPTSKDLKEFGHMYCHTLNSVYKNFKPLDPIIGKEFITYPIVLGNEPEIEIPTAIEGIEDKISKLIDNKASNNLWLKRIIKVYQKNVVFLYKPNQKRYWLQSIAIRDADETFIDLFKQGK
ncbi:HsdM family class I SAM-dependent methyltransferase [Parapedobacter koreensis]|uniref:site-specific DNA-methyltransferase (adenine-specific) n=1 Tax=Parapedobacter koreensis TaxID=332977 RepID=A0A1H7TXB4_9SPHI|nr:N-6 DNA methylase [Parapedobacter koreensis]SEL89205.1 N-6 DNA Methylase [Parapedobacter koreensis]